MVGTYIIRAYKKADAAAVISIFVDNFRSDPALRGLHSMTCPTLVAEFGDCIVAFACMRDDGVLLHLIVQSGFRLQGIGSALLIAAEEAAIAVGLSKIFVQPDIGSEAFFARRGFGHGLPPDFVSPSIRNWMEKTLIMITRPDLGGVDKMPDP